MNIYKAIYILNKKAKELSENRMILKEKLENSEDILVDTEEYTILGKEISLSPWFPCGVRDGEFSCFKEINAEIRSLEDECRCLDSKIYYLMDEINSIESEEEKETLQKEIDEYKEDLEYWSVYIQDIELFLEQLNSVKDNREEVKNKLRELRELQVQLYRMKEEAINIMKIPVVAIHLINDKLYKYHTYMYEDVLYKYHTICYKDEEKPCNIEIESIDYTPTLIDIDDSEYNDAYLAVKYLINENIGWDDFLDNITYNDSYNNDFDDMDEWDEWDDWKDSEDY